MLNFFDDKSDEQTPNVSQIELKKGKSVDYNKLLKHDSQKTE